ncbi:MAG: hypothetical protein L0228_09615 [Planctomycetes bacterium]|nr:hypothetical protein [Planctomycetota bacterium]
MIYSSLLEKFAEKLLVALGTALDWLLVLAGRMYWTYVVIIVSAWVLSFLSNAR